MRMASAPLIEGWMPPSRENYDRILFVWQYAFIVIGSCQWMIRWYGMGKTSVTSRLNLPGRAGWIAMEVPGFLTLLYIMATLPGMRGIEDLPWQNKVLAGLFVIHYIYRAIIFPIIAPSMSPLHVGVALMAVCFQLLNGTCLGSWLAGYGPVTQNEWGSTARFAAGFLIFYLGLAANVFHDEALREIRRREMRRRDKARREEASAGAGAAAAGKEVADAGAGGRGAEKHYQVPEAGLFRYMLYPHYLCEWVEWAGFWLACGWAATPARVFLLNEVVTMLPRAVNGRRWYVNKFGEDKVGKKWAILPGVC